MTAPRDCRPFFEPESVAVIGAGERLTSSGGAVLRNLIASKYAGRIVPVNPKGGEILGLPAATSLSELDAPFFMVPGNRDRFAALRGIFPHLDYLPAEGDDFRYAVDGFPLRLIGLDSMLPDVRKGVFGADRISWLEEALGQAPDTPTLLFMHHPPFDVPQAGYTDGYRDAADAEALTGAVSRHRQVIRLICGHVHVLHGERWGNAIATTMPSVAVDVRKGVAPEIGDAPVYMLHEYSEDGELDSVMQVAGAARDA